MANSTQNTGSLGVVVGFDGSPHSFDALSWASQAAQRRQSPLTVVAAYTFPYLVEGYVDSVAEYPGSDPALRAAQETLAEAEEFLKGYDGDVEYRPVSGDATGALVKLSHDAQLLVVGRRGLGRFWGRLLGSVASAVPAHAACPTVVVTAPEEAERMVGDPVLLGGPDADTRPVTVGMDSSPHSRQAALVAADEAARLGVGVHVVLALPPLSGPPRWYPDLHEHLDHKSRTDVEQVLNDELTWLQQQRPEAKVSGEVRVGAPAEVMIEQSGQSQLTVLGTRGRGGFASLLLGSVSRTTLFHCRGTVMVVPHHHEDN